MNDAQHRLDDIFANAQRTPSLRSAAQIEAIVRSGNGGAALVSSAFMPKNNSLAIVAACCAVAVVSALVLTVGHRAESPAPAMQLAQSVPPSAAIPGEASEPIVTTSKRNAVGSPRAFVPEVHSLSPVGSQFIAALDSSSDVFDESDAVVLPAALDFETVHAIAPWYRMANSRLQAINTTDAMTATMPISIPEMEEDHPTSLMAQLFLEGGMMYSPLRGGFRNVFSQHTLYEPENFSSATTGGGFHVALGMNVPVASWLHTSIAFRYLRYFANYQSTSEIPIQEAPVSGNSVGTGEMKYTAALTFDELAFEPTVRLAPFGGPVFMEGGVAAGMIVGQSALYSGTISNLPSGVWLNVAQPAGPQKSTSFGKAGLQVDVRAGIGADFKLSKSLLLELQVRGQYGLNPLFTDNYPHMLAILPMVGLRYNPY